MFGAIESSLPLFRNQERAARERTRSLRAGAPTADLGLSKVHISPLGDNGGIQENDLAKIHRYSGAGLVKIVNPYRKVDDWRGAEEKEEDADDRTRGEVTTFSRKSRANLQRKLATIPNEEVLQALLVTLTYPEDFPIAEDYEVYKVHLDNFLKSLVRRGYAAIWVLEFQKRGAPHYHLLVFGHGLERDGSGRDRDSVTRKMELWMCRRWFEICNTGDQNHVKAGVTVEWPRFAGKARHYIAKYTSKGTQQAPEGMKVGRYWGVRNESGIPKAEEIVEDMTPIQSKISTRTARRYIQNRTNVAGWSRLYRDACKKNPEMEKLSPLEFEMVCRDIKKDPHTNRSYKFGDTQYTSLSVFISVCLARGGTFQLPGKWRLRNNSTYHVFCDADAFYSALTRHPEWNVEEKEEQRPRCARTHGASHRELSQGFPTGDQRRQREEGGGDSNSFGVRTRGGGDGVTCGTQYGWDGDIIQSSFNSIGSDGCVSHRARRSRKYTLDTEPRRYSPDPF